MHIPGFHIEREIGRSSRTRAYLAQQQHPPRRVALKVTSCGGDASSRLEQLKDHPLLRPGFRHPHIALIHGAGVHERFLYLVMEHLEGGDLEAKIAAGISLHQLIDLYGDLCGALDHAHRLGVAYGEVSLSSILFRSEAEAVLTHLCPLVRIAGTDQPARLSQQDLRNPLTTVVETLDQRPDLYALGASFYTALTGRVVPQRTYSDARTSQQRGGTKLPAHLQPIQTVLDQAMSVDAAHRFQSGTAFKSALKAARSNDALDQQAIKTAAVAPHEIPAVDAFVGQPLLESKRVDQSARNRRSTGVIGTVVLAMAILAGGAYLVRQQPLWVSTLLVQFGLTQDPVIESAWADAESLSQDPNQGLSAQVAGYRRVLELDPKHSPAHQAIEGLLMTSTQGVRDALVQNDLNGAAAKLARMELAFPGNEQFVELQRELVNRRAVDALLASTQALLRSQGMSHIPAATAAIQVYQEILRLAPGHPGALTELILLAEHYGELAREAAARGDVDAAIIFLERATIANGDLPVLALVRDQIQQAATALATIEELLQQAGAYRAQGFLVHPLGENAAQLYHRVLATAPDNSIALQGLNEVTSRLLNDATRMLEQGDLAAVEALMDQAGAAGINAAAVVEIKTSLDQKRQAIVLVQQKLAGARALLQRGFITEPQENSAVALLREIQRLDPENEEAGKLLSQAAFRLAEVAQEAFDVGLHDQAKLYLDLALTVTPDEAEWRALRQSWQ